MEAMVGGSEADTLLTRGKDAVDLPEARGPLITVQGLHTIFPHLHTYKCVFSLSMSFKLQDSQKDIQTNKTYVDY